MTGRSPSKSQAACREKWRRIPGVTFLLHEAEKTPGGGPHQHGDVRVSPLLEGAMAEVDEFGRSQSNGPLTLHVSPAHRVHAHVMESRFVKALCFDIRPEMLETLGVSAAAVFERPVTLRTGPTVGLVTRFHHEMNCSDEASDLVLRGLIFELAAVLQRRQDSRRVSDAPAWLRKAREMIHDSYADSISLAGIADAVGVHPSSLARVFRQFMSASPGEYLRRVRVEQATREVLFTDRPLKEIAKSAGFSDPAHFSREFRRANGASPKEMRQGRLS